MKNVSKFIKGYDGYGKSLIFNINGHETVRSFIGGFCYLIDVLCLMAIILINFYNFFFLPDPLITYSEVFRDQNDFERISPKNLLFSNFFVKFTPNGTPVPIETLPAYSEGFEINLKNLNGGVQFNRVPIGNFADCEKSKDYMENEKFKPIYDNLIQSFNGKYLTCFNVTKDFFSLGGNILTGDESSNAEINSYYNLCNLLNKEKNCTANSTEIMNLNQLNAIFLTAIL